MEKPATSSRGERTRPWKLRLSVLGAALISILVFAPLAWHVDNTFGTYGQFVEKHQDTESLHGAALGLNLRLVTLAGELVSCGDGRSEDLRDPLNIELDAALCRIRQVASPCMVQTHFAKADSARRVLRQLENQALDLSGAGAAYEAQAVLQSPSYRNALGFFSTELDSVLAHCNNNWSQVMARERNRELGALAGAAGILVLSLGTWITLLRTVENRERKLREDAVERHRTAEKLASTLGRCEKLFNEAYDSILLVDPETGRIIDANRQAARRLGHEHDQLTGMPLAEIDVGLDRDLEDTGDMARALDRLTGRISQRHHRRRDGSLLTMEVSSHLVRDGNASILQCFCRDVTQRNRLERELCEAQKMECVGRAASGIVHDFSNLLVAIRGHTTLAGQVTDDRHPAARHLRQVGLASTQAMEVARSLLTFAGNGRRSGTPVELTGVITATGRLLRPSLPADVSLKVRPGSGDPLWAVADGPLLQQALLNLGLNARDAVTDGGCIELTLQRRDNRALIMISDDGEGIAPELGEKIWEPFFTTRTNGKSSGLGLFNVKAALDSCGGTLEVAPRPGGGTCFLLSLPLTEAPALDPVEEPEARDGTGLQVLLADPHGFAREVTAEALRLQGCEVTAVATAGELMEALAAEEAAPPGRGLHLAIVDLGLAGAGGRRCLEQLRRQDPDLPLIIMRGHRDPDPDQGQDPATVILDKPFELKELGRLVLDLATRQGRADRAAP
jgi:PAS domain S-box-containing protein